MLIAPSRLNKATIDRVTRVIEKAFDLDSESHIEVTSTEVDLDERTIRIELLIITIEEPEVLGRIYFKLTDKVRKALGPDWHGFFPLITPWINPDEHA